MFEKKNQKRVCVHTWQRAIVNENKEFILVTQRQPIKEKKNKNKVYTQHIIKALQFSVLKRNQITCGKGNEATKSTIKSDLRYCFAISFGSVTRSPRPKTPNFELGLT